MKDRIVEHPNQYLMELPDGTSTLVNLTPEPGEIVEEGTPLNKANLLSDDTAAMLKLTSADPTVDEALSSLHTAAKDGFSHCIEMFNAKNGSRYQITVDPNNYVINANVSPAIRDSTKSGFRMLSNKYYIMQPSGGLYSVYDFATGQAISSIDYTYCKSYFGYDEENNTVYFAQVASGSTYKGTNYLVQINLNTMQKKVATVNILYADQVMGLVGLTANYAVFQWSSGTYYEFAIMDKETFTLKKVDISGPYSYYRHLCAVNPSEDAIYYSKGYDGEHIMYRYDIAAGSTVGYAAISGWNVNEHCVLNYVLCDWDQGLIFMNVYFDASIIYQVDIKNPAAAVKLVHRNTSSDIYTKYMGHIDDETSIWVKQASNSQFFIAYINNYNFSAPNELISYGQNDPRFGMAYTSPSVHSKTIMPRFLIGEVYWWDTKDRKKVVIRIQSTYDQGYNLSTLTILQIGNSFRHVLVREYTSSSSEVGAAHRADADLAQYPVMSIIESREDGA